MSFLLDRSLRLVLALLAFGALPSLAAEPTTPDATTASEHFEGDADGPQSPDPVLRSAVRRSFLRTEKQAGFTPEEKTWIADNCQWGMPEPIQDLGPVKIVVRKGYVLGHSSEAKIPYWVCERCTEAELSGPGDRDNSNFKPDPVLAGSPRSELNDYKGSGFDRGHMAPAANHKITQQAMDDTFFLSNMAPQTGPTYNRGIWAKLEDMVRDWVRNRGQCWVITGGMFYDALEEDPATADGLIPYFTIGDGDVAVPTHCYKIVLAKNDDDEWETIAFVLDNKRHGQPYRLELHRTTIDWLEDRTGLDFFPELTKNVSTLELMNKLEANKSAMWESD